MQAPNRFALLASAQMRMCSIASGTGLQAHHTRCSVQVADQSKHNHTSHSPHGRVVKCPQCACTFHLSPDPSRHDDSGHTRCVSEGPLTMMSGKLELGVTRSSATPTELLGPIGSADLASLAHAAASAALPTPPPPPSPVVLCKPQRGPLLDASNALAAQRALAAPALPLLEAVQPALMMATSSEMLALPRRAQSMGAVGELLARRGDEAGAGGGEGGFQPSVLAALRADNAKNLRKSAFSESLSRCARPTQSCSMTGLHCGLR